MTRKLFYDMATEMQNRFAQALHNMTAWAKPYPNSESGFQIAYNVSGCKNAWYENIEAVVWYANMWLCMDKHGYTWGFKDIDFLLQAEICDYIERTYSPNHQCGDPRI